MEVVIPASYDVVDRGVLKRFARESSDVVSHQGHGSVRPSLLERLDVLPVSLDGRRFGFNRYQIWALEILSLHVFVECQSFGDAIVPCYVVSFALEEGGGLGRNHRVDVGRLVEVLKLPVLREQGDALRRFDGRIGYADSHLDKPATRRPLMKPNPYIKWVRGIIANTVKRLPLLLPAAMIRDTR